MTKPYGELVNFDFHAPFASQNGRIYTVKSEDTLSGIARREFGDSRYWPFIWLNNINLCHGYDSIILTPSLLTPGKVIKLPDKRLVIEWVRRHRLPEYFFNSFSSDSLFAFYLYMHNQDPKNIPDPFQCAEGPKYSQVNDNSIKNNKEKANELKGRNINATYTISFEGLKASYPSINIKEYVKIGLELEFKLGKVVINKQEEDPFLNFNQTNLKGFDLSMKQKCDLVENCISAFALNYKLGEKGVSGEFTISNAEILNKLNVGDLNVSFDSKSFDVTKKVEKEFWDFKGDLEAGISLQGLILKGSIGVSEKKFNFPYTTKRGTKGILKICYSDLKVAAKITILPMATGFAEILYEATKNIEENLCSDTKEYKDAYTMLQKCSEILYSINLARFKKIHKPYDNTYNPTTKNFKDIQKQLVGNKCNFDAKRKKYSALPAKKKPSPKTRSKNKYATVPTDGIKEVIFSPAKQSKQTLNMPILYDVENYQCTNELLRRKKMFNMPITMDLNSLKFYYDEAFDDKLRKSIISSSGLPFSYLYIDTIPGDVDSHSNEIKPFLLKEKGAIILGSTIWLLTTIGRAIISMAEKAATVGTGFIIMNQEFYLEISRAEDLNQDNYKDYNL